MNFGVNGVSNNKPSSGAPARAVPGQPDAPQLREEATNAISDALALQPETPEFTTSSRQLAREFAEKYTRLQSASPNVEEYDEVADAIGTHAYLLVDTVNRLCRDTQGEPLEERIKALNMIQHVQVLPDELREAIEADLRRTSVA